MQCLFAKQNRKTSSKAKAIGGREQGKGSSRPMFGLLTYLWVGGLRMLPWLTRQVLIRSGLDAKNPTAVALSAHDTYNVDRIGLDWNDNGGGNNRSCT